jgi:hypothetical protein
VVIISRASILAPSLDGWHVIPRNENLSSQKITENWTNSTSPASPLPVAPSRRHRLFPLLHQQQQSTQANLTGRPRRERIANTLPASFRDLTASRQQQLALERRRSTQALAGTAGATIISVGAGCKENPRCYLDSFLDLFLFDPHRHITSLHHSLFVEPSQ